MPTRSTPPAQGDALYAMELALSLEKLNFTKLRELHDVAEAEGDAQMCDFVEGDLLDDQASGAVMFFLGGLCYRAGGRGTRRCECLEGGPLDV